jgi:hypothetical protein
MVSGLDPLSFLLMSFAGWINQRQQHVIEYLVEENRVLRESRAGRGARVKPVPKTEADHSTERTQQFGKT